MRALSHSAHLTSCQRKRLRHLEIYDEFKAHRVQQRIHLVTRIFSVLRQRHQSFCRRARNMQRFGYRVNFAQCSLSNIRALLLRVA